MKRRIDIKKMIALLTVLIMAMSIIPAGVITAEETSGGEGEQVVVSPFTTAEGVITDYDIQASDDAEITFEPETGAARAIVIHSGTVKLSNNENVPVSRERIIVAGNATLILAGVDTEPDDGPAVRIAPEAAAKIELAANTTSTLVGGNDYAGLEVGWAGSSLFAKVTISGEGTLYATGQGGAAGIGGSYTNKNSSGVSISSYHGEIVINSGTIIAAGKGGGAGIGSGNNNRHAEDGSSTVSASYRMTVSNTTEAVPKWGNITITGGSITATSTSGAGIGGGSHVDSSLITIAGGTINATGNGGGGAGIGCGIGSQKQESNLTKGPGYYNATIIITGGSITARSTWLGAGVGGGYACDAKITISGGTINATGGNGNSGANYQGGPGVGAGYMGVTLLTITGGTINAKGGTGAPGIGYGAGALEGNTAKERGKDATYKYDESYIRISGGKINASGGINGAGIGGGNGNQYCHIAISGGDITARGYSDPDDLKVGGAGIGSGTGLEGGATKYKSDTELDISISGDAKILAIGGWGASGIGSGAANKMANVISIQGNPEIEAYADGTKFAIDTRVLEQDGTTSSKERDVSLPVLQGTFVRRYTAHDGTVQNPEGLDSIQVINDRTGSAITLTKMPDGYRSFATDVGSADTYTIYTDSEQIGEGGGRYFKQTAKETFNEEEILESGIQYSVSGHSLSDNYYLYPVKTVEVEKRLAAEQRTDLSGLNASFFFGLYQWTEAGIGKQEGEIRQIVVKNGVPQGKIYFTDVPDGRYEVLEVDENGEKMKEGAAFGIYELRRIGTEDGSAEGTNNGEISPEQWTGKVIVTNTFGEAETALSGEKTWNDEDDKDGVRPVSITVKLFADGKAVDGRAAEVSSDSGWKYRFEGLKMYHADGTRIEYTVREDPVPEGYEAKYADPVAGDKETVADIENVHIPEVTPTPTPVPEPETTQVTVTKQWDDMDDLDGTRPDSVTVVLFADGQQIRTEILNGGNNWTAMISDLPRKNNDGTDIRYTWTEKDVEGYTATITVNGDRTTIRNSHTPELISVTVAKVWADNGNARGLRPNKVVMRLNNGMHVTLNEANNWTATITGLPASYDGEEIEYSWTEQEVIGYTQTGKTVAGNRTVFTNALWTRPVQPAQGKTPKEPGESLRTITDYETPLGVAVQYNHVGDCFD